MCVHAQSCLILWDHMDCRPSGSSVHGILQPRILEWAAISSSRGSSQSKDQTPVSCISCIGRWILYRWATWEAQTTGRKPRYFSPPPSTFFLFISGSECWYLKTSLRKWVLGFISPTGWFGLKCFFCFQFCSFSSIFRGFWKKQTNKPANPGI